MKPHFFGSQTAPLYGVYEAPRTGVGGLAVLACYPIAAEYMRAHRAFRQMTNALTRAGAHVMRFDYRGTGDSFGRVDDGRVSTWLEDIGLAIDELRELCGRSTVKLVGLRFGAVLAALAADDNEGVDQVVLWDPIVDGARYRVDLEATHLAEQSLRSAAGNANGLIGVHGFPVPESLRAEMVALDLRDWHPGRPFRVDLVVSSERPEWEDLASHLSSLPGGGGYEHAPSAGDWGEADEFGSALIPQQIIQSVVTRLTEGRE